MPVKYRIRLTSEEQNKLKQIVQANKIAKHKRTHAQILLALDENGPSLTEKATADVCAVSLKSVQRTRKRCIEEGLEIAVESKFSRHGRPRSLDGEQQAHLVALTCSEPPEGQVRWTLKLLADKLVELDVVDSVSAPTICRELKKNELKPWQKREWCIPAKANAEFVSAMEDVLDLYKLPHDPKKPLVCMDESSKQQVKEVRIPLPMKEGLSARYDNEYERNGVSNLFMFFAPLEGWRHVEVTNRRTAEDWALQIKQLVDVHYPEAEVIRLVMDNLNTHTPASLYKAFKPEEARRIASKLEIHYTPKHGSWLNMAEIELSILSRQCLDRRIPDQEALRTEVSSWEATRNQCQSKMDWRFTNRDARIKLKKLYPSIGLN
jgi:transposase